MEDRATIAKLWKPSFRAWFPGGAEDPDIVLLKIAGMSAEYWDNTGTNRFRYIYQSLKALVSGTTPEVKEGEQHGNISLPG